MTIAPHELRSLAKSPFVWIGLTVAAAYIGLQMRGLWPVLSSVDAIIFTGALPLSAGCLVAGAWLGMRDRKVGVAEIVEASPSSGARVTGERLAALAIVAGAAFVGAAVVALSVTFVRGGRGVPDARLIVGGALACVVAALAGHILGAAVSSRAAALFAAPAWAAIMLVTGRVRDPASSVQWLSAVPEPPRRSTTLGFLPDMLTGHVTYLAGLALVLASLGTIVARSPALRVRVVAIALLLAGLVVTGGAASWLLGQPDDVVVRGVDEDDWVALRTEWEHAHAPNERIPDEDAATTCVSGDVLRACVFPAYGEHLARYLLDHLDPEAALLSGLPGVATEVKMVAGGGDRCSDGEIWIPDSTYVEDPPGLVANEALCGADTPATEAVELWVHFALGRIDPNEALTGRRRACAGECTVSHLGIYGTWDGKAVVAADRMAELDNQEVLAVLTELWPDLKAGEVKLADLPGAP